MKLFEAFKEQLESRGGPVELASDSELFRFGPGEEEKQVSSILPSGMPESSFFERDYRMNFALSLSTGVAKQLGQ